MSIQNRTTERDQKADWHEDASHENGRYENRCINCRCVFLGHKRRVVCRMCAVGAVGPAPGQEQA